MTPAGSRVQCSPTRLLHSDDFHETKTHFITLKNRKQQNNNNNNKQYQWRNTITRPLSLYDVNICAFWLIKILTMSYRGVETVE